MQKGLRLGRFLTVIALAFAVLAVWQAPAAAQEGETATLVIHKADCPVGTTGDIFEECHENRVSGVEFDINGTSYTTDGQGVIEAQVSAGDVAISEIDFDDVATGGSAYVYCSIQESTTQETRVAASDVLFEGETENGNVTVSGVPTGSVVICDWYNRTIVPATLTIHKLECPENASGDIFEACHDNRVEGVDFTVGGTDVTTDDEGVASASVNPGDVTITEHDFETYATAGRAFVYCSVQTAAASEEEAVSAANTQVLFQGDTETGEITVNGVPAGSEVICDWYNRVTVEQPTPTATTEPTVEPTEEPTQEPTEQPTEAPTEEPTERPSGDATATPTSETKLPETGVGASRGGSSGSLILGTMLFVLTVSLAALGLRRRPAA